ncbi:MAG: lipase maturation factor family protein [Gammaproteobacteria bacterium]|nr:lipase maturation factor family protein [Gammaproteobacteria bacterium]
MVHSPRRRPLLIYDGDCGSCRYWIRYWAKLTGDAIQYEPYQAVGDEFPDIPPHDFKRAIQFVSPDGKICSGAEASYRTLSFAKGQGFWLWLYKYLPGFSWVSELVYLFLSRHRPLFHRISILLWGRELEPARFAIISWVFLRYLGLIYFCAFVSLGTQILGLAGSNGIIPLHDYLVQLDSAYGLEKYWLVPTILWFNTNDFFLQSICILGALVSLFVVFNFLLQLSLIAVFVLYLSLFYAGHLFMAFQWDLLLLETGFLAIFLCPASHVVVWLYRWLLFRLMFLSGAVKLLSNDASWANLSALSYHYETQPLPTPIAWYIHHWPAWFHTFSVACTFVIELVIPFLIFAPRRVRFIAGYTFVFFQITILVTGNYNFFNLLVIGLCIFLFDDAHVRKIIPHGLDKKLALSVNLKGVTQLRSVIVGTVAGVVIFISSFQLLSVLTRTPPPRFAAVVTELFAPFRIVNPYGLFAVMTTMRPEIIVEGSYDRTNWIEYEFEYKPGNVKRRPRWNIPHQPRLDWQMWFAALGDESQNPWFGNFLFRLLQNSPDVLNLLHANPFPEKPPTYIRALLYDYKFTDPATKRQNGQSWVRELEGMYFPTIQLREAR